MDIGTATIIAAVVNALGIIWVGHSVNKIKHATNGMKAELEKGQYDRGVREEHDRVKTVGAP